MLPENLPPEDRTSVSDAGISICVFSGVRLYRDALVVALSRDKGNQAFGARYPEELASSREACSADVAVIDAGLPHSVGLMLRLRQLNPVIRIVVVAVANDDQALLKFAEAGVNGMVDSNGSADDLVRVVREAVAGEFVGFAQLTHVLLDRVSILANPDTRVTGELTRREQEIACLLSQGLSNKEIAGRLRIGNLTVKNHVHHIFEKLGVRRRSQVAAMALRTEVGEPTLQIHS